MNNVILINALSVLSNKLTFHQKSLVQKVNKCVFLADYVKLEIFVIAILVRKKNLTIISFGVTTAIILSANSVLKNKKKILKINYFE